MSDNEYADNNVSLFTYLERRLKTLDDLQKLLISTQNQHFDDNIKIVNADVLAKIQAQKELSQSRFESIQEAIKKAENSNDKRFENVNDFRSQLAEQTNKFATKEALESWTRESRNAHENLGLEITKTTDLINKQITETVNRLLGQITESTSRSNQTINETSKRAEEFNTTLSSRISNLEGRMVAYLGVLGVGVTLLSAIISYLGHVTATVVPGTK